VCSAQYGCCLQFLNFALSQYVAQVTVWVILRWFQSPLLLRVSLLLSHYYYYYYYYPCYPHYAQYLQLRTSNKPCPYAIYRYSCSLFTLCATCNVISPLQYVLYLYISTSRSLCAVPNMAVVCSSLISRFVGRFLRYFLYEIIIIIVID
jgi:hypothetical protein